MMSTQDMNITADDAQQDPCPGDDAALRSFVHAAEFMPRLHNFCENPTEAELDHLKAIVSYH